LLLFVGRSLRIGEKWRDVLPERRLLLFDDQDIGVARADDISTKAALGMQHIRSHHASQPGNALISLVGVFGCSVSQLSSSSRQATCPLVAAPADGRAFLAAVFHPSPPVASTSWPCLAPFLLGSCVEQKSRHHFDERPGVTPCQCSGHARSAGKLPGPVQLLLEPVGSQLHPLRRSLKRRFPARFPHSLSVRSRRAFSSRFAPIFPLLQRMI